MVKPKYDSKFHGFCRLLREGVKPYPAALRAGYTPGTARAHSYKLAKRAAALRLDKVEFVAAGSLVPARRRQPGEVWPYDPLDPETY